MGRKCCISRGEPRLNSGGNKLEESEKEVTVLVGVGSPEEARTQQGEQLQEWDLPRVLNLEKESSERFKRTHLEQIQRCINLPRQITFAAHTKQVETGQGLE